MSGVKKLFKVLIVVFAFFLAVVDYYVITHPKKESDVKEEEKVIEKTLDEEVKTDEIKNVKTEATLTFVGDFLYEKDYLTSLDYGDDVSLYFAKVRDRISKSDISLGTMGLSIVDESTLSMYVPKVLADQVASLGIDVISLATNHSNDMGLSGRIEAMNYLKNKKITLPIGVYEQDKRDVSNNIIEKNGIKFGFLAYTYGTNITIDNSLADTLSLYMDPQTTTITDEYKNKIIDEVNTLRSKVDCLVVMMYWGGEYTYDISPDQDDMTKLLNSLGVDIIVGTHSHNMQKIEWYKSDKHDTLVYYSLGNFVSADKEVYMAPTYEMVKSYQIGLISDLKVSKENDSVKISDIKTEPIVNYYDKDMRNFTVVPLSLYNEELEKSHYLYSEGLTKSFINDIYEKVIDSNFR